MDGDEIAAQDTLTARIIAAQRALTSGRPSVFRVVRQVARNQRGYAASRERVLKRRSIDRARTM